MEFWGIEVKPGESVICDPGKETYLHISQAALGEIKKASENVYLYTKVNDQKLVLGTLSGEKFPQASFDLVFEKEFSLSHSSKSASVFVCGYKSAMADPESDGFSGTDSESESEPELEPIQLAPKSNAGKIVVKEQAKAGKTTSGKVSDNAEPSAKTKSKAEVKSEKPKPENSDDDDSEDDDESDDDSDSEDEAMPDAGDDSDDDEEEDDDDSSDEDVTPKKDEVSKKRAGDSSTKSSGPEKKAKLVTPATKKSDGDGKKGSHTATPYPKQVGKNASTNEKSKQQVPKPSTPKSGGAVTCKSCSKTFNSENALQAHSKAKHEAK